MPQDYNDYFLSRISAPIEEPIAPVANVESKFEALQQASLDKISQLTARRAGLLAAEKAASESWSGQLGLDTNGVAHRAVNAVASFASGTARVAGQVLSLPTSIQAMVQQSNITDDEAAALSRFEQGISTPQDEVLINTRKQHTKTIMGINGPITVADGSAPAMSPLERYQTMTGARNVSDAVKSGADYSSIVQQDERAAFTKDLLSGYTEPAKQIGKGWTDLKSGNITGGGADVVSGIAELLMNAAATAGSNKQAAFEYMVENIPQLFVGAAGKAGAAAMAGSNAGYALDTFNEGVTNYQAKNGGALPPEELRRTMAMQAAQLMLSEQVGDVASLGLAKIGSQAVDGARATLISALANATKAGTKGFVTEAATEGYQTYLEGEITGKPATGADIYAGSVIGGVSGSALSGGGRAVTEAATLAAQPAAPKADKPPVVVDPAQDALVKESISTGDVTGLTDPKTKAYAPDVAIRALFGNSQLDTVTPEAKQANLDKADKIIADLELERDVAKGFIMTPAEKQAKLDEYKAQLAGTDPKNTSQVELLNSVIQGQEEELAQPALKAEALAGYTARVKKLETLLVAATSARDNLSQLVQPREMVEQLVSQADQPSVEAETQTPAVERVLTLAMASQGRLDPAQATKLADNMGNSLTAPQRDYLRAFSEARIAENALVDAGGVSADIYTGKKNKGIAQYRAAFGRAIAAGNLKAADAELEGLSKFEKDHASKAKAAQEAIARGMGTQIVRTQANQWEVGDQTLSKAELAKNGGLAVNSGRLVASIQQEAAALTKAVTEMRLARNVKSPTTNGNQNVTNDTQSGKAQPQGENKPEAASAQNPEGSGTGSKPVDAGAAPAANAGTGSVEAGGISPNGLASFRQRLLGMIVNSVERSSADEALISSIPKELVAAAQDYRSAQLGLKEAEDILDGEDLAAVEEATSKRLAELKPKMQELYDAIGKLYADGGVATKATTVESGDSVSPVITEQSAVDVSTVEPGLNSTQYQSNENTTAPKEPAKSELAESVEQEMVIDPVVEPTAVQEPGQLSALSQKSPEGTPYKSRNLLADYFRQVSGSDLDDTKRPLVVVKDFLSNLSKNLAKGFLATGEISDPQLELLKTFKSTAVEWQSIIKSNLVKRDNPEFYFKDLMQFLIQGDAKNPDLEENVKTAMSYAAFSWVVETAGRPRTNGPDEINTLLDRAEGSPVTEAEFIELGHVGARQNTVINSLGQRAVQALGLKATKDAKGDLAARLEATLGAHILKLLLDTGMATRSTVDGGTMARLTGKESTDKNADHFFIALDMDQNGDLHPKAVEILAKVRGTGGVLDKLFSVESGLKEPSLEPIPYKQGTTKNTSQQVPSVAKPILEHENSVASYVHPGMYQFASIVDESILLEIAGGEDLDGKHAANVPGVKAKNDALQREIRNMKSFFSRLMTDGQPDLTKPMYFDHMMLMVHRVGISTNMINPQTSKIHRHSMYRQAWETEIDPNNGEQMEGFLLRVGEGLGVKTDKQGNEKSLTSTLAKIDKVQLGVDALARMLQSSDMTTMPEEDQKAVLAAVKAGGEKMHSLASLMALAQFKVAGDAPFKVQLMGEVDGVTNGPMLSHLLLGAADSVEGLFSLLNRGGFFEQGNEHTQYNLWREAAGHFDLYETTAGHMTEAVKGFINDGIELRKRVMPGNQVRQVMNAIYGFTGELADKNGTVLKEGRNIIKTPLTAMVFGSSVGKAVQSMADKFIGSIYAGIEDASAGRSGAQTREQLIENLNLLLSQSNAPMISVNTSLDKLMSTPLTPEQIKGIQQTFKNTLGKALRQTMEEDFGTFIAQRKEFNTAAQLTHAVYDAAYSAMYDQILNEQMDLYAADNTKGIPFSLVSQYDSKGKIDKSLPKLREPLHDLSAQEVAEIRSRLKALTPIMHTAMSKDSGQLAAGLYIGKRERKLSTRSTFKGEVKFGTGIKGTSVRKGNGTYSEQMGMGITGMETVASSPGVSMSPMATHSSESAIMHYALGDSQALNVHDAQGVGVGGFQQSAESLNTSLWNVALNYSPAHELYSALTRTIQGFAALVESSTLPPEALAKLVKSLQQMASKNKDGPEFNPNMLQALVENAKAMSFRADDMKLQSMAQTSSINQYALQGGNYEVTAADREAAGAKRTELTEEVDEKTKAALAIIESALKGEKVEPVAQQEPDIEEDQTPAIKAVSPFGELGEPFVQSDSDLVAFFKQNPSATFAQVADLLAQKLNNMSLPNREFNVQLLKMLKKAVSPSLSVHYVTGQTKYESIMKAPGNARGWYTFTGDREAVYVLGTDFKDSGLTVELLLHELTHAAVAQKMHEGSPEAQPYIDDLQALLEKARAFVKANRMTEWAPAVSNLDELVAWGMTNDLFQQRVLAKIKFESKAKSATGLQAFIQKITGILFGGWSSRPEIANGMESLVSNVTNLFAQATQTREAGSPKTITVGSTSSIKNLEKALKEVGDMYEADGSIEPGKKRLTKEQKAILDASDQAFQILLVETSRLITRMQAFGTEYAKDLAERLNLIRNYDESEDADGPENSLINLTNDARKYAKEFSDRQSSLVFSMAAQQQAAIEAYSTMDLFNGIDNGSLDTGFQDQLRGLLGGIVEKLHGPFGAFKDAMRKNEAGNPLAVWLKALETGKAPFASQILASGFTGNNQQDFVIEQVEATVRAALNNEAQTKESYRELAALYSETYARLKPQDFMGGLFGTTTMDEAQALYDFVFKLEKSNGDRSDYLARFAALGLAHQGFNSLLQVATTRAVRSQSAKSFTERLQNIFEDMLAFFQRRITNTYIGQRADDQLETLVGNLVSIEAKKRHALKRQALGNTPFIEPIEKAAKDVIGAGMAKVGQLLNSAAVRDNKNAFIRATGGLTRTVAGGRVDQFLQAMSDFRDSQTQGRLGIAAGLVNNIKGPNEMFKFLLLGSKNSERTRQTETTQKAKFALESFANGGRDLGSKDKSAITSTFLRTGAHNLLGHMDLAEIEGLLDDSAALEKAISKFEGELDQFGPLKNEFIEAVNGLGHYKGTGINRILLLRMNAYAIASRFGATNAKLDTDQVALAAEILKPLITLYALRYTPAPVQALAKQVMRTENARPADAGNGVEFVMELQKHLEQQSQERLFNNDPALMVHGFTPEIYNYRTLLVTATEADGRELVNLGYSKGAAVPLDPADPDQTRKYIYRLADGGLAPHLTGVIGYTGKQAKGSEIHSGYMGSNSFAGQTNTATHTAVQAHRQRALQAAASANPSRDLSKEKSSFMAPVFSPSGAVVNWRYLMADTTKDALLERNNDFSKVIGTLAGSIQGKVSTIEQNNIAVDAMLEQYMSEYATKGSSYVNVGPKSPDASLREIWSLLPKETKDYVHETWGKDGLQVRSDSLDLMFGYRKLSAATMFNDVVAERKSREDRGLTNSRLSLSDWSELHSVNTAQKILIGVVEGILVMKARKNGKTQQEAEDYAKRASMLVSKGERVWQEVVSETKDLLVVKTGTTLVGNIFSNLTMLYLQDVPIKDQVKHALVALKGATSHRADSDELAFLKTQLETGTTRGLEADIRRRILILEDAIARNPVTELINAGLMPTIVEDLASDEDIYSYKSALTRKVEGVASKLNPTVVSTARVLYVAHDTKLYRGLSHITQMSDFVARYALYQHLISRKKNPLSKKEAISRSSDAFVNYDIPLHRGMQYSDDMGFTMFTKYFLYIQRELWRVSKENPARVYSMLLLNNFMDLGPIVLDSSAVAHLGNNPMRDGALGYLGALDKLITVNTALAVVK